MSMPGEPQIGLPGNHIVERIKQEAGIEMALTGTEAFLAGTAINFVGGLFGRRSAKKQRAREEAFLKMKYEQYDLPLWEMGKQRLIAERDEILRSILLKKSNEEKLAKFKDANNLRTYKHALQIHQLKVRNQQKLYEKSERLYKGAVESAKDQAALEFVENSKAAAYKQEELLVESIMARGKARAKGRAGVSAAKAAQTQLYDEGRQVELLVENLINAQRDTNLSMQAAISAADAQRMLKPEAPPAPLKPAETPIADYIFPRYLQDFDFGPKPIMGIASTPVPSMGSVIANAAGAGFSAYANTYSGNVTDTSYGTGIQNNTYARSSDVELKENITYIDQSPDGHAIYEWNYKGEPTTKRYQGAIAQDLLKTAPYAVVEMDNGYLGVKYNEIDINFTRV